MIARKQIIFSPGRTILLSILATILFGTILLMLPQAQNTSVAFIDCLFTATSATCVTGVLTVPFESFTFFGKSIILALIQIGGIGLLTLTLFLISLFMDLGLSTQFMVGQIFELERWKNPRHILFFIISLTVLIELFGALCVYFIISSDFSTSEAIFRSLFHSITAFCNAGLNSSGHNILEYRTNPAMLAITGFLVFCGGFGFMTWYEISIYLKHKLKGKRFQFSLTSRVVFSMTALLLSIATILLLALEGSTHFAHQSWWITVSNMFFNAIAYRSTGFTTMNIETMQTATVFMIIMYSFIGSSPGSTGGGIKVTTFAIFLATIRAVIAGRTEIDLKGRRLAQDQIFKAMAVLSLSVCWIIISTFFLSLIEKQSSFISVFFEAVSSFTSLGLATDITPYLSLPGKILTILNMFIGRVGSLTLLLALRIKQDRAEFQYPEERLIMS